MLNQLSASAPDIQRVKLSTRNSQRSILPFFWVLVALYTAFLVLTIYSSQTNDFEDIFGGIAVSIASIVPFYIWCSGKAFGLPIFPLFSITYLWTCAIPLISDNPSILKYSLADRFFAGITVTLFLSLGTFIWYQFVNRFPHPQNQYRVLDIKSGDNIFLLILSLSVFYSVTTLAGWLQVDAGTFSIIRGAILGLSAISTFALSYRYGSGKLSSSNKVIYLTLLASLALADTASLLLISALTSVLISIVAYSLGRGKFPIATSLIIFSLFALLHSGKAEMRSLYWQQPIEPWNYVSRYAEWAEFGFKGIFQESTKETESEQSLLERASVIQQLLLTQSETEKGKPLLDGYTYAIIPQLLVPRIFNSEKITSHEGTAILNIYYGRQTRKDTQSATIGWGLLAEAYANFGVWGCVLLAFISGAGYGYVSLLSVNAPVFSDRYLFAILVLSYAFQTEFTAGVYVAALFQSSVTLLGFVILFMKVKKWEQVES